MIELIAASGLAKCLLALAAVIGSMATLVSAVQAARKPKPGLEPETRADKALDRLSLLPRGIFRGMNGKSS